MSFEFPKLRLFQTVKRRELSNEEREDVEDMLTNSTKKQLEIANELNVDVEAIYAAEKRMLRRKEREERNKIEEQVTKKRSLITQYIEEEKEKQRLMDFYLSQRPAAEPGENDLAANIAAITELINSPVVAGLIQSRTGIRIPETQEKMPEKISKDDTIAMDIAGLKTAPRDLLKPDLIIQMLKNQPAENRMRIKQTYESVQDLRKLAAGLDLQLATKDELKIMEGIRSL
jgi:hypothetical protein